MDLESGAAHQVYPRSTAPSELGSDPGNTISKVTIFGARFSADGKRALIATDGGAQQALVLSIDLATGQETARYVETRPATAEVQQIYEAADNGPERLDAFKDVETAARWAASQPWADKRRMVALGGSYGGYTVLIALTRMPEFWRAGIEEVGPSNLRTALAMTNGTLRQLFRVEFGDLEKDAAFLDSISPLRDVDKIVAPLFVYAGANDPRVPRSESDLIVKALRARKVPVEYMVADNEGHSMDHRENQLACHARMLRFLETLGACGNGNHRIPRPEHHQRTRSRSPTPAAPDGATQLAPRVMPATCPRSDLARASPDPCKCSGRW